MKIFVDESGQFKVHDLHTGKNTYECVVSIVIDDCALKKLEKKYGSFLKEELRKVHAGAIIKFLVEHNAVAIVSVYDADQCRKNTVQRMKADYIDSIYRGKKHPDWILESVKNHEKILFKCSLPQFIKVYFTIKVLENTLRTLGAQSNNFSLQDLQSFSIVCDDMTEAVIPTIKYFTPFAVFCYTAEKPLNLDNPHKVAHLIHSDGKYFNGKDFFSDISFSESKNSMGLRVVDVVSNQVHRLFNGNDLYCDIALLSQLFSSPYSLSLTHLDIDKDFIEVRLNSLAMQWYKGLPTQINI